MLSATIFNCCPCHSLLSTLICIFVGKRRGMLTLQTVIYCCCFCQCSPCRDLAKSFFCGDKRCAYVAAKYSLFCPCRSLRHNLLMKHSAGCASPLRYFVIRYWKRRTDAAQEATKKERRFTFPYFGATYSKSALWRRGRDSNPCGDSPKRFSRPPRYDRFDTSPFVSLPWAGRASDGCAKVFSSHSPEKKRTWSFALAEQAQGNPSGALVIRRAMSPL